MSVGKTRVAAYYCKVVVKCGIIALILGNAIAKYKGYLVFQAPKYIASENAIAKYCNFFFNSATVQFYF